MTAVHQSSDRSTPAFGLSVDIDESRWPDVARAPRSSPLCAGVAGFLLRRAFERLPLTVRWGQTPAAGGTGPLLEIHDPEAFVQRIGADGLIGFGESYMAGEWSAEDLVEVLTVLAANATSLVPRPLQRLRGTWMRRHPAGERNSPEGARENIRRHYDLSNQLFALFLDDTMTYSSAVFPRLPARWDDLASAQRRKIDRLLDAADVGPGTRLLEIGTGWGELATRAAARGARVVTVTLSREQRDLAVERITRAGHADRVSVRLCDYREIDGVYDAVVSVEMIEAVGAEYWPVYFDRLAGVLAPGGRIALQAITMPHKQVLATRGDYTWIRKYIFPGGVIPSLRAVRQVAAGSGLRVENVESYGEHYAETLRLWRHRFLDRADGLADLGFDETFRRMWEFYLAYCEAGFRARYLDVHQVLLKHDGTADTEGAR
ncbi:class I SAM-dependent methyltransferase [Streptomyces sp. NPDC048297]|uniref:class I SAM-dependent methyltransferase n=1 Tax=Streptomyces sp. NPDC048297 TaxID=3365531 RepID=UPI0037153814